MSEDKVILALDDRWHKWPEEVPEHFGTYHIRAYDDDDTEIYTAQWYPSLGWTGGYSDIITHWRELPPPPEKI